MYLREAWVIGNAGLVGGIIVILLAHVITVSTGLAVSSIATNIRVGAGGAFSIISQSLGLEVGGSISIPLYLAQGVSTALYVLAFAEGVRGIFGLQLGQKYFGDFITGFWIEAVVIFITFALVFAIAYISAKFAARIQFFILAIVGFSLFSIFMGSFAIAGQQGFAYEPTLFGPSDAEGFWDVFAVFFPAVTGIMAGISLSGMLRDPRKSIPEGTMSAIGITLVIYLLLAYWLSRVAPMEELASLDNIVMADRALWRWAVLAGILGATFSSALGSLVAAPRVLQALGQHQVVPFSNLFAQETAEGEPRPAMITTGVIALGAIIFALISGGLNAIAPLITMFFLIAYAMLNAVVLIEQTLAMVSFRPTFPIPRLIPLVGLGGCLFVMFLVNPIFSLVALGVTVAIYFYLQRRQLETPWEDVRSGLFRSLAEWAAERVVHMPPVTERTWKPSILAPVTTTKELTGSYRFLRAITAPQGAIYALGVYSPSQRSKVKDLEILTDAFLNEGIFARATFLEQDDFATGIRTATEVLSSVFFRPNILFLPFTGGGNLEALQDLFSQAIAYRIGVVLLARHPVIELGREQLINVWVREQGPEWQLGLRLSNLDLAVLLAHQLKQNWNGRINLCMAVEKEETIPRAEDYFKELITRARLKNTDIKIIAGPFLEVLDKAPTADLSIFGLQKTPNWPMVQTIIDTLDASCIFVRDSGDESALA